METDKNNDVSVISLLPPGVKEYLSTYNNEEIARKILSKRENDPRISENDITKGNSLINGETAKDNGEHLISENIINEKVTTVEKPSFKIFGFEFAPIFIPLERRLQVII